MDASEAIAREEIRDVISRYNHAGDRGDLDALVRCFTETGVLDLEGEDDCEGRAAIRERLSGVVSNLAERSERALLRHHVSSIRIELTGSDTAIAASYSPQRIAQIAEIRSEAEASGVRGVPSLLAEDGEHHWGMGGLERLLAGEPLVPRS